MISKTNYKSQKSFLLSRHRVTALRVSHGFTLMEMLIVVSVLLILVGASSPLYTNFQVSSQLNENVSQIIQTLRTAREKSAARTDNSSYGVKFKISDNQYVLYQGSAYDSRTSSYDRETALPNALSLSLSLKASGVDTTDVNFSKGLGVPNATGTITVTHNVRGSKTININDFGRVGEQ